MALDNAAFWPREAANGVLARTAALASRNIRTTVAVSLILICGSFAAAAALQMRFDRVHALGQARYFEARRARDLAVVAGAALDRIAGLGRAFADGGAVTIPDGVRNIAVFSSDGRLITTLTGSTAFVHAPKELLGAARKTPALIADAGLAMIIFADGPRSVAMTFDTDALVPAALTEGASITAMNGMSLIGVPPSGDDAITAAVRGWPVVISILPDDAGALTAWYGSLPLYLFVILGPSLVGAWLASLFVHEFERRSRAAAAVRELRATNPANARLLIRLAQAERDASEAQRSKAEFIAHMSHELRTPLNAIIGFSEIIERGMFGAVGNSKYLEYARDIANAGRGLHTKIGDILEFANLEAGRYPIALCEFDLSDLANTCVQDHVGRAFSRRIRLDVMASEPALVRADPLGVKRILTNLLSNALAFTPEGGSVRVVIGVEEGAATVSVLDTGPGFLPHESASAGNAFRRFDRERARTGTGLGLAIAMALARRMGGALRLASAPNDGTRTELRLQRA
jgi:signal transduction histidine kinase